jgi:hypothetical protein
MRACARARAAIIDMSQPRMVVARSKTSCIYYRRCEAFTGRYHVGPASGAAVKRGLRVTMFACLAKKLESIENRYQFRCDVSRFGHLTPHTDASFATRREREREREGGRAKEREIRVLLCRRNINSVIR